MVYSERHMAQRFDAGLSLKPGEDPRKSSDEGSAAARAYKILVRLIATCELAPVMLSTNATRLLYLA